VVYPESQRGSGKNTCEKQFGGKTSVKKNLDTRGTTPTLERKTTYWWSILFLELIGGVIGPLRDQKTQKTERGTKEIEKGTYKKLGEDTIGQHHRV